MHRRQIVRHAGILRVMMNAGGAIERIGDSFVQLAEHPDFLGRSRPHRDAPLERHLWACARARGLVDGAAGATPMGLMRHDASGIVHGTLPGTGLLPVIICWFEPDARGLFIAADFDRGHAYHRLSLDRPPKPAARPRWRPFGRAAVTAPAGP